MWQKYNGEFHLLLGDVEHAPDGSFLQTACQEQIRKKSARQKVFPSPQERRCGTCSGVSSLINTSVDDAKISLKQETRLVVLYRAVELTTSKTLKQAIESRIRQVADRSEERRGGRGWRDQCRSRGGPQSYK
jgi:hypothetical protein